MVCFWFLVLNHTRATASLLGISGILLEVTLERTMLFDTKGMPVPSTHTHTHTHIHKHTNTDTYTYTYTYTYTHQYEREGD